jgi:hypothetical protein
MHLYPVDGAAHNVRSDEMAFNYRDANWAMVIVGVDPDSANRDIITTWSKQYWDVYFTPKPYHHFIPKAYHFDTRLIFIFH